jgi:hypothetical protein
MKAEMEKEIRLFGFGISHWPRWVILILGMSGILISFFVQGTSQEGLYTNSDFNKTGFFIFIQFFGCVLLTSPFFLRLITNRTRLHALLPELSNGGSFQVIEIDTCHGRWMDFSEDTRFIS